VSVERGVLKSRPDLHPANIGESGVHRIFKSTTLGHINSSK
jgi:hypothetical protein